MNTNYNANDYTGRGKINTFDALNGISGGQLTEDQVRKIVQDELLRNANSGTPIVPRHTHDGNNSPKIGENNLVLNLGAMGQIHFARQATYTIYFPTAGASQLTFNGFAYHTSAPKWALINATAILKPMLYFQPIDKSDVGTGGIQYPITGYDSVAGRSFKNEPAQSSTSLFIDRNALADFTFTNNQFQLIHVVDSVPNQLVSGTLNNLTINSIDLTFTTMTTNWNVIGNFTVI